jgi:hypothetical protein
LDILVVNHQILLQAQVNATALFLKFIYLFIYLWGAINIGSTYTKNVNLGSAAAGYSNMGSTALE